MNLRRLVVFACLVTLLAACVTPSPSSSRRGRPPRATDPFDDAWTAIEEARDLGLPPGNYRVDVERVWLEERDLTALGLAFGIADDGLVVEGGGAVVAPGFRVGVVGPDGYVELTGAWRSTQSAERSSLFLVTLPDFPASLVVGETRWPEPFTVPIAPGFEALVIPGQQFVGAAFDVVVSPRGEGLVQVSLTPTFTGLTPDGEALRVTELTTTVLVPVGHTLVVSSTDRVLDDVASTLFTRTTTSGVEQGVITLKVSGG